ncbi:MAG: hypothetical protein NTZ50_04005 [Chloroflexi bacterium]|nr:hypothetical protein [Chloroflexota bacterium]
METLPAPTATLDTFADDQRMWTTNGQLIAGSLVMALLGAIPLIGGLFSFAFVALGLGALVLTRLGTREWKGTAVGPTTDGGRPPTADGEAAKEEGQSQSSESVRAPL